MNSKFMSQIKENTEVFSSCQEFINILPNFVKNFKKSKKRPLDFNIL
jgi:hypothetical protein